MPFATLFTALAVAAAPGSTWVPQPLGPLWSNGQAAIEVTRCTPSTEHDPSCRGIALRRAGNLERLGEGYLTVDLVWRRGVGGGRPDAVVRGDSGGSGGYAEIFVIDLSHGPAVRKLALEHGDTVAASAGPEPLRLDIPFGVGGFNGAPHSQDSIVPVPLVWDGGDFRLDLAALAARPFPPGDLRFRELAVRAELNRWSNDLFPATTLYPAAPNALGGTPVTVAALLELMLAGRADQAHALLHRAWPRSRERTDLPAGGEDGFWTDLCRVVALRSDWRRFGFDRLPHARLIEAAAARTPAVASR